MSEALINRLECFVRLSPEDKRLVRDVASGPVRRVEPHRDLIREGTIPRSVCLVLEGWACRYKVLEDGRRQIVALFLPGDLCDAHVYILAATDHSIGALTHLKVAEIDPDGFERLLDTCPRVTRALWWSDLVTVAMQREWTVNIGARTAYERIAHLMCETYVRLEAIGLAANHKCPFPLTQMDLADAMGLTAVHINRTLQELRRDKLVRLENRALTILDWPRLRSIAMFTDNYLHLHREGHRYDANS